MKYLRKFNDHSEYVPFTQSEEFIRPNVSYCVEEDETHYNPSGWKYEYFTTVARENGTISFNIWKSMGTEYVTSISYSTDNGETWTTTNNTDNKEENLVINVNVEEGDKIIWKGDARQLGYEDEVYGDIVGSFFSSTCEFDAQGNVMSLLYGDNFNSERTIENNYAFCSLFYDYDGENACEMVNAKNLSLPATTLANGCYQYMFYGCTSLTIAPELPATTLANYCYASMFQGCTSLTTAPQLPAETLAGWCYLSMFNGCTNLTTTPELPATTLADYCYTYMFSGCTSLTEAPELPATTLMQSCYDNMFRGCTSLTTAPELPATTLTQSCYSMMFYDCTSLTTAPELPAITLASGCYNYMFRGCTSLTTAPELPAMTLTQSCYLGMFRDCTSLTTAPVLPATTLVNSCYENMFSGCTSLNYIKAMFTTTPSGKSPNYYTTKWVDGVAASGTFVKNSAATWDVTGVHGIPEGWTVQNAS